ncbi:MAG: MMPL family transporter [Deltaproteobacteria bacterium]|jgi:predicted exporter|nr:MMPL family transporter [Deltaproteobacteria bacterium]
MPILTLFAKIYHYFSPRRRILYSASMLGIVTCMLVFSRIDLNEDIRSMLPDNRSEAALDFRLLQQAPFTRKVIINLSRKGDAGSSELLEAVDRLAEAMRPPFFANVVTGPSGPDIWELFFWLMEKQPNLATAQDREKILHELTAEGVQGKLEAMYARLHSPEGSALQGLFRADPLALRRIGLEKIQFMNIIPRMRLEDNHFISSDSKNALIIADTSVPITDTRQARQLLGHFQKLVAAEVPRDIEVSLISGHRYALANTDTIKRDVFIVLACSSFAMLAIFLLFLRTWGGLFVYLVPVSVLCIAAAGVSLIYETVSVVTIGFGAVLLGISVDFALHVYFAIRHNSSNPSGAAAEVARPVLFCGMTTLGAFSVLLFSCLPSQRQLAIFSIIGIGASMILSLVTLPHLVRAKSNALKFAKSAGAKSFKPASKWILGVWLGLLVICAWQGAKLSFDGDLRSINLVPQEVQAAENKLRQTWGNFRGNAVIFAEGLDLQSALETNERLFNYLSPKIPKGKMVSLAPILPSLGTQRLNRSRWNEFWSEKKELARSLLVQEGEVFGFSAGAFEPFFKRLAAPSPYITAENLKKSGLAEIVDALIMSADDRVKVLTLVPDEPEVAALMDRRDKNLAGVRFVSQNRFSQIISRAIGDDFTKFIAKASVVVCLLLGLLFRNIKKALLALVPVVSGLLFVFGVMGGLGMGFNLFNVVAAILIIGLGVDYGILVVCKISEGSNHGTEKAVFVSGLTTLAGFGALVMARHPALHSIGVTVLLGIGAAIPSALFVIPALYQKKYE